MHQAQAVTFSNRKGAIIKGRSDSVSAKLPSQLTDEEIRTMGSKLVAPPPIGLNEAHRKEVA